MMIGDCGVKMYWVTEVDLDRFEGNYVLNKV